MTHSITPILFFFLYKGKGGEWESNTGHSRLNEKCRRQPLDYGHNCTPIIFYKLIINFLDKQNDIYLVNIKISNIKNAQAE